MSGCLRRFLKVQRSIVSPIGLMQIVPWLLLLVLLILLSDDASQMQPWDWNIY